MTTLVTGATGRIGSRFVPRLLCEGERVRVLTRDPAKTEPLERRGAEAVLGDLRDSDVLERSVGGVDAVVHLAAAFRGVSEEETVAINHAATIELADAALRAQVETFVLTSTNLVYGPGRGRPSREDDEPEPRAPYPASKFKVEEALRRLHRDHGLGLRILRLAFVYGEDDPHLCESTRWTGDWPSHKRLHMVHHADVGQALMRALRATGVDGEIFNIADDAPISAAELLEINGEPIPGDASARPLDDPWEGIVDTRKARAELGFRPIYPTLHSARDAGAL